MSILNHGTWSHYVPAKPKEGLPPQVLYLHRDGDGVDWYEFRDSEPFHLASTLMTASPIDDGLFIIQQATFDHTAIWPVSSLLLEHQSYEGTDPFTDLHWLTFDPATGQLGERYVPPLSPLAMIDQLTKRIAKLEKRR